MTLAVLNAFLWRAGGAGAGPWRKVGWPVLVAVYGLTGHHSFFQILGAVGLAGFAVSRPFTYYGDKLTDHWFNWVWLWVMGLYLLGPMACYGRFAPWTFAWSLAATLSNLPRTAKVFTWEFCECLAGFVTLS